jgi:hypothetical protein
MSLQAVLLPLFVQVALTFGLMLWLAPLRVRALGGKDVHPRDIALGQKAWPERAQQIANCFSNQFELPVLFYVLVILAVIAHKADLAFVILSWIFVASRFLHAIHPYRIECRAAARPRLRRRSRRPAHHVDHGRHPRARRLMPPR